MNKNTQESVEGNCGIMLTGNHAAAWGARLARVEVMPLYPITPSTSVVEKLVEFIANGELNAEYIPVESEHSAMAVAICAEATGVRTFTATSSQGLAYMHENLFCASGHRMPVVMTIINRAIGGPPCIYVDLMDSMDIRDTSWLQVYVEDSQEIVDTMIMCYKIAEDKRVLLPTALCYAGMLTSYTYEPVILPEQDKVDEFLPPYHPTHFKLDPKNPQQTMLVGPDYWMEYRYQQQQAMEQAKIVIKEVTENFANKFGRSYGGLVQEYFMEDAEYAVITIGHESRLGRVVVEELRKDGIKIGMIKVRWFRPFPKEDLQRSAKSLKQMIVFERDASIGLGGVLNSELCTAINGLQNGPKVVNYVFGLGGRTFTDEDLKRCVKESIEAQENGIELDSIRWVGVRGLE